MALAFVYQIFRFLTFVKDVESDDFHSQGLGVEQYNLASLFEDGYRD